MVADLSTIYESSDSWVNRSHQCMIIKSRIITWNILRCFPMSHEFSSQTEWVASQEWFACRRVMSIDSWLISSNILSRKWSMNRLPVFHESQLITSRLLRHNSYYTSHLQASYCIYCHSVISCNLRMSRLQRVIYSNEVQLKYVSTSCGPQIIRYVLTCCSQKMWVICHMHIPKLMNSESKITNDYSQVNV